MFLNLIRSALAGMFFPFSIYQKIKEVSDLKKLPQQGQLVNVGKHTLNAVVQGEGDDTVVFDSGLGSFSLEWNHIQQQLSHDAVTVAYDRAGYGWSHKNKGTATSFEIVEDLRKLLKELKLEPPYLLVGHSFGGLNMRLFAQLYPEEVSGLVMVDATNEYRFLPEYVGEERQFYHRALNQYRLGYLFSVIGMTRLIKRPVWNRYVPIQYQRLGYRIHAYEALFKEYKNIVSSCHMVKDQEINPDIPIIILTAGQMDRSWKMDQTKLKNLSMNCKQIVVEDSYHNIHAERPDVVIHAIKELLHK